MITATVIAMTFRKNGKASLHWRRWKTTRQDELLRCGLPDFILKTERDWVHFLQEGYDVVTDWRPEMLRGDQQLALYHFLQKEYGNTQNRCLLHDLAKSLGIAGGTCASTATSSRCRTRCMKPRTASSSVG